MSEADIEPGRSGLGASTSAWQLDSGSIDRVREGVQAWTLPICLLGGGIVVAYVIERVLHHRLAAWAARSEWKGAQVIARVTRGMAFIWLCLASVHIAAGNAPLSADNREVLHNVASVLWVLSGTVVAARMLAGFFTIQVSRIEGFGSASIFANVISVVIYAIGGLVMLQTLGVQITPILTALGVGGLAVALALQDTLSNLFAGIHILIARHVRAGDQVRIENGDEGRVADIGWRNTTIVNGQNNLVVVPNAKLASVVVTNFSLPSRDVVFTVPLGVAYGSDLERVERVAIEVAAAVLAETPGAMTEPPPVVRYHALGQSSVDFNLILHAKESGDQILIKHALVKRLHARFHDEGIDIPFPTRTVLLKREDPA
jgi:small-conductance mechanosensitive channel